MHDRQARPTLRLLREDLTTDWEDPAPLRALSDQRLSDLHPLCELPHPVIRKAASVWGSDFDPAHDAGVELQAEPIRVSTEFTLWKVRTSQWRAGVWVDPDTGVRWICVAGLSKGGHQDHADFYETLGRRVKSGRASDLLPSEDDDRLLRRETASRLLADWEIHIQEAVVAGVAEAGFPGTCRVSIEDPTRTKTVAIIGITLGNWADSPGAEEIVVIVDDVDPRYRGTDLGWTMQTRVLTALCPPQQGWDRYGNTFSTMADQGHIETQIARLREANERREVIPSEPGKVSHYSHRTDLAGSAVDGSAVRALCGVYFVNMQDHADLPRCPDCQARWERLPQ